MRIKYHPAPSMLVDRYSKLEAHCSGFICSIIDLHLYLHKMNSLLESEANRLNKELKEKLRVAATDDERKDIVAESTEHYFSHSLIPDIHSKSTLISLYSFFESCLNDLCYELKDSGITEISLKDFKYEGIMRAKLYLSRIAKIDFGRLSKWQEIDHIRIIRNNLVHNLGELPDDDAHPINKYVESNQMLTGEPGDYVSVKSEYLTYALDTFRTFFEQMEAQINLYVTRMRTDENSSN